MRYIHIYLIIFLLVLCMLSLYIIYRTLKQEDFLPTIYINHTKYFRIPNTLKITFINFWTSNEELIKNPDNWFINYFKTRICENTRVVPIEENPDIIIFSVFGDKEKLIKYKAKLKLFYYGENLLNYPQYNDQEFLYKHINIIYGFKYTDPSKKIFRFPLWLINYPYYSIDDMDDNILVFIQESYTRNINIPNRKLEATLLASHQGLLRKELYDEFSKYIPVLCPGKFIKNYPDEVKDKIEFIKTRLYNICTENSVGEGYVTEKLFDALQGGCIPIYSGEYLPEPDILNENCYMSYNNRDNTF